MLELINAETVEILNFRIQQEQYSSRIYEQMSLALENMGFSNLAKLYDKYSKEELEHAGWAKTYLLSHNVTPTLELLESPTISCSCIKEILDETLTHEILVTNQCEELGKYALSGFQMNLLTLAQRYNKEQVEELNKATTLISAYNASNSDLFFDHYVGENYL